MNAVKELTIHLAKKGVRPSAIARQVGRKPGTIYQYIREARRSGENIPHFRSGPIKGATVVYIPIANELAMALTREAAKRGMTTPRMGEHIIRTCVEEDLLSAVLDDGGLAL